MIELPSIEFQHPSVGFQHHDEPEAAGVTSTPKNLVHAADWDR
jgi:hypothetical protein